jgi:hypothetical protein
LENPDKHVGEVHDCSDDSLSKVNPLKDATNILKALFRKHDLSSVKRDAIGKFDKEQWS